MEASYSSEDDIFARPWKDVYGTDGQSRQSILWYCQDNVQKIDIFIAIEIKEISIVPGMWKDSTAKVRILLSISVAMVSIYQLWYLIRKPPFMKRCFSEQNQFRTGRYLSRPAVAYRTDSTCPTP